MTDEIEGGAERQSDDWGIDRAFARKGPYAMGAEPTYSGALSFCRRPYATDPAGADVVITGVPYDLAVTNRPGTRFGPRAIREASSQLAWDGGPWRWPFDPFAVLNVVDAGDCDFDPGDPLAFADTLQAHAARLIGGGGKLLSLGGDHFVTYPLLKAHAEKYGPLSLIQFDAHSDTWAEDEKRIDHGTMFYHAAREGVVDPARSVQIGIRTANASTHGFTVLDTDYAHEHSPTEVAARVREVVGDAPAYLTFDIDCLDPSAAPGTGTPVIGGLSSWRAERILCALTGVNLIGMDVVEVSPPYDHSDITALAGATMALNGVCLMAAMKGG